MEKEFHSRLKNIISKELKSRQFSVTKEAKIRNLIIDIKAVISNSTLLFECEVPSNYMKFICYKNKAEKELLELAFAPYIFVKRCLRKASNVLNKIGILPILVVPSDYFPVYLKQKFSDIGINVWFVNLETSEIERLKPKNKFKTRKEEIKHKSIADYIISYSFSKYSIGEARQKQDEIVNRIKKDEKFFKKLKEYFENKDFARLNKLINSI